VGICIKSFSGIKNERMLLVKIHRVSSFFVTFFFQKAVV